MWKVVMHVTLEVEDGLKVPGTEIPGHETPDVGAGNRDWVLCKRSYPQSRLSRPTRLF